MYAAVFDNDRDLIEYLFNLFYQVGTEEAKNFAIDEFFRLIDEGRIEKGKA